jgi:large repetitive protein
VQLSWNAAAGATGYEVWHATTSGGPYTKKATVASLSYLHTAAVPGTTQYYVVRTKALTSTSANSAQVAVTTPALPPAPANTRATAVSSTRVSVSWDLVAGATGYEVWRSTTSGGPYTKLKTVSGSPYTDTTASPATTYFYVVRTVSAGGTSSNSAQATVTTP